MLWYLWGNERGFRGAETGGKGLGESFSSSPPSDVFSHLVCSMAIPGHVTSRFRSLYCFHYVHGVTNM